MMHSTAAATPVERRPWPADAREALRKALLRLQAKGWAGPVSVQMDGRPGVGAIYVTPDVPTTEVALYGPEVT